VVKGAVRRATMKRFPYQVFFTSDANEILVIAVHHAKRNPSRWRERT
jgi:hypothetical protein